MASNPCFSVFAEMEEVQILHFYGLEVLTMAKRVSVSNLLLKVDKVDVEDFLKATFTDKKQVILAPYHGGSYFSLNDIPCEALEEICVYKPSSEPSSIIAAHNEEEYNVKRISFVTANPDGKASALNSFRDFVFTAVLENIAANIHKEFASYFNPMDELQLLLLGNRKVYSTDKQKIQRFETSKKKSEARAALPSTSSKQAAKNSQSGSKSNNPVSPKPKQQASQEISGSNLKSSLQSSEVNDKKRSTRKEVNYKEASGNSTSSVEYPVEGKHTDDESEAEVSDAGNRTPVFNNQIPAPVPNFMSFADATTQPTAGLPEFYARIPKNKKKKASKYSAESPNPSEPDSKPASTKEKKRLERKHSSKRNKKSSRKSHWPTMCTECAHDWPTRFEG